MKTPRKKGQEEPPEDPAERAAGHKLKNQKINMAINSIIRDGTRRDCFGGKKNEDGTGPKGEIMKYYAGWSGRDGSVGVRFIDGTGPLTHFLTTGRDGKHFLSRRDGTGPYT